VTPPAAAPVAAPAHPAAHHAAPHDPAVAHAVTGNGSESPAVHHLLDEALKQVGDQYVFGAEVDVNDPDPKVWDCAELTKWAAHQGGSTIPGSSFEQYLDLKAKGLLIPVDQAEHTPGALLFHFSQEPQPGGGRPDEAHVALSLGDGRTVEAQSEEVGVITDHAAGRFEYAALLPDVDYGGHAAATPDLPDAAPAADAGSAPDAGGLTQDQVIYGIKMQESHGDYHAENPTSTASGAYQYIDGTWDGYGGYSHASDAPPAVQDQKMEADTKAAHDKLGDWERVIASHFAGEDGQQGPKSDWDKVPGFASNHNPSIRDYVDGVEGYIKDADPSMFAAAAAHLPAHHDAPAAPAADPHAAAGGPLEAAGLPGSNYTVVNVTIGGPGGGTTAAAGLQPTAAGGRADPAAVLAAMQQAGIPPTVPTAAQPGVAAAGQPTDPTAAQPTGPTTAGQPTAGQPTAGQPTAGQTPVEQPSTPTTGTPQADADHLAGAHDPAGQSHGFQIDPGVDISNPDGDADGDGLTNHFEQMIGSNPTAADTDGDHLIDGLEVTLGTDPLQVDSDHDGFTDGAEMQYGMNPLASSLGSTFDSAGPTAAEPPDATDHDALAAHADAAIH